MVDLLLLCLQWRFFQCLQNLFCFCFFPQSPLKGQHGLIAVPSLQMFSTTEPFLQSFLFAIVRTQHRQSFQDSKGKKQKMGKSPGIELYYMDSGLAPIESWILVTQPGSLHWSFCGVMDTYCTVYAGSLCLEITIGLPDPGCQTVLWSKGKVKVLISHLFYGEVENRKPI